MEQAARLRENSMRKRLDEILQLKEQDERFIYENSKRPADYDEESAAKKKKL